MRIQLCAWIFLVISTHQCHAEGDPGTPDTLRFSDNVTLHHSCATGLRAEIPIFLYTDNPAPWLMFDVNWTGSATLDSVVLVNAWAMPLTNIEVASLSSQSARVIIWLADPLSCGPCMGEFARLLVVFSAGDTVALGVACSTFYMGGPFEEMYQPSVCGLDTPVVIHAPNQALNGDANFSGLVTISDAVFLISYIFVGGCEPLVLNSGDVNGDCMISISDVVYLIQYIFSGGQAPQAGCVQ